MNVLTFINSVAYYWIRRLWARIHLPMSYENCGLTADWNFDDPRSAAERNEIEAGVWIL